ncbi:nucleotide sugar dehydrogenase [Sphingomonas sp. NSE70-1]|uniref:Nucleotide sugar dehydrogenase n=1 Tax=Sphingomonas caseinilyticus TaxID=2908205 RepID=A0ABT0RW70_9SPHN|nr:nucleotide sugar dehydrogenase [Sphingomonas caseinilyticus]
MQSNFSEVFTAKLEQNLLRVGIVGLGYVGIPLMLRFHELGFSLVGIDSDEERVSHLSAGKSPIRHIAERDVEALSNASTVKITSDFSAVEDVDAIIFCVPTPLSLQHEPDMSFVRSAAEKVRPHLRAGQLLALESTVYPGATEEVFLGMLQDRGFTVGQDIFLAYSPEREDPGNALYSAHNTPKVCGGHTHTCGKLACLMYSKVTHKVVPVSSMKAAELTKLLENIHRSVNIGLVNEMKVIADRMHIDIHEVIKAAATKPFGFTAFYPGPGLGGHCIPIDPFYLTWKAREFGVHTRFIELAGQINSSMPEYVISKIIGGLNGHGKAVSQSNVMVLGLSYKKNIDDVRESPAIPIIEKLKDLGANVCFSDSYVTDMHGHYLPDGIENVECTDETVSNQDCVVVVTDHDYFDYPSIAKSARLIIDTRGRYARANPKVVSA